MREILFRGKRMDNREWIYGDLLQNIDAVKIREQEKSIRAIAKSFTVDPETVGEYTGLTDANGKKIFEGDIIQYQPDNALAPLRSFVVYDASEYSYPAFDLAKHDYEANGLQCAHEDCCCEVIGNIYDNPELLEKQNEQV